MIYPGTTEVYISIDSADNLAVANLTIGASQGTYPVTATYTTTPPADVVASLPLPKPGRTRYWWMFLAGAGGQLPLTVGENVIYGMLNNPPQQLPQRWTIQVQGWA